MRDFPPAPPLARTHEELAEALSELRSTASRLGLVPTMGALHEGHLSLVDLSREACDATVVSIFVNPLQFGEDEDLDAYPRDLPGDLDRLAERGVDLVFAPGNEAMYPAGEPLVTVDPGPMGDRLCGAFRPGHFRGVLTVVAKLFGLVRPDVAVFGRKDFQQSVLIRRMVEDLELGIDVLTGPVVREPDGLAMSSRNLYLSDEQRRDAAGLSRALDFARQAFLAGESSAEALLGAARTVLDDLPRVRVQYLELVDPETLEPMDPVDEWTVALGAVFCGDIRLIDNLVLGRRDAVGSRRTGSGPASEGTSLS